MPHRIRMCTNTLYDYAIIINIYGSLMHELKKNGKVFTSKFVGTGPSSYEKRIYQAAVSQRLRNTGIGWTLRFIFTFSFNLKKNDVFLPVLFVVFKNHSFGLHMFWIWNPWPGRSKTHTVIVQLRNDFQSSLTSSHLTTNIFLTPFLSNSSCRQIREGILQTNSR
jgi:hypothetical protein